MRSCYYSTRIALCRRVGFASCWMRRPRTINVLAMQHLICGKQRLVMRTTRDRQATSDASMRREKLSTVTTISEFPNPPINSYINPTNGSSP